MGIILAAGFLSLLIVPPTIMVLFNFDVHPILWLPILIAEVYVLARLVGWYIMVDSRMHQRRQAKQSQPSAPPSP